MKDPGLGRPPFPYTTPARVLLNGLGSDELLGGYGRHRTAYTSGGWSAVIQEVHTCLAQNLPHLICHLSYS